MPSSRRPSTVLAALIPALLSVACAASGPSPAAPSAAASTRTAGTSAGPSVAASGGASAAASAGAGTAERTFRAEVWADNWFALYVNGIKVGEDSVPITTERSFNAETITFKATYPLTIAMVTRDYMQNDSGLEYIGTARQQMGDGGFIAQVRDVELGRIVAATGPGWRALVIQRAPLNPDCERAADPATACRSESRAEPAGWQAPGFDDSGWGAASVYTEAQVGVKEGYLTIAWDPSARLIWGADLKVDNVILWRWRVPAPG